MKLAQIKIENIRSIKDITLNTTKTCTIFVGKNESGKSNILQAISFLKEGMNPYAELERSPGREESAIKNSNIKFIFELEDRELKIIEANLLKGAFGRSTDDILCSTKDGKKLTIIDYLKTKKRGQLKIQVKEGGKKSLGRIIQYFDSDEVLEPQWKSGKSIKDSAIELKNLHDNKVIPVSGFNLINTQELEPELAWKDSLAEIKMSDINSIVGQMTVDLIKENLPNCIFWKFSEEHILPTEVPIEDFCNNPEKYPSLKCMFNFAGYPDIKTSIEDAKSINRQYFINFLNSVAQKVTDHLNSVWKESQGLSIFLGPDGSNIIVSILEKDNQYTFEQRSDGFKRLFSFVLFISTQLHQPQLKNTIIVVDEPETGLHPAAAADFRQELIKLGETNYVFYGTHSIFMIDDKNIPRHFIVKKDNKITTIKNPPNQRYFEEEVLYLALGTSMFSILKQQNIAFEGYWDKRLFKTALEKDDESTQALRTYFSSIGVCHCDGLPGFKYFSPIIQLAQRHILILSDDDAAAKQHQREYLRAGYEYPWRRYSEILPAAHAVTAEDFLKPEAFEPAIDMLAARHELDKSTVGDLRSPDRISTIRRWISSTIHDTRIQNEIIGEIKEIIFSSLTPAQIDSEYFSYLDAVKTSLETP